MMASVPNEIKESLLRYADNGIEPGGFLRACLENDLLGAVRRADAFNVTILPAIVEHIADTVPWPRFGDEERVRNWLAFCAAKREAFSTVPFPQGGQQE